MKANLIAHCRKGNSDKIYMVCIRAYVDGTYQVIGKWGRNGRTLKSQVKLTTTSLSHAIGEQERQLCDRLGSPKEYVDIDDPAYDGDVTRSTPCVQESLEPDITKEVIAESKAKAKAKTKPKLKPKPKPKLDEVRCIDNRGLEDKFDEGITYLCEVHSDSAMIWVHDKLGRRQECFKERFVTVK